MKFSKSDSNTLFFTISYLNILYFECGNLIVMLQVLKVMYIEVADRRRWQSAMTSPIGDVGSKRVNVKHHSYSFRYTNTAVLPQVRTTTYGLKSFRFSAAKLWNSLPNEFRSITSFNQFKNVISGWNGDICHCAACQS